MMSPRTSTALIFAIVASIAPEATARQASTRSMAAIVVDEEKDGLPGTSNAPARKEIEALIRAIGREPVSDELVDRIDGLFRPRWARNKVFEDARRKATDPAYVAKLDLLAREVSEKPADTRALIHFASLYNIDNGLAIRAAMKTEQDREKEPRKTIKGQILDDDSGRPIQGAVVSTEDGVIGRTNAKGVYTLKVRSPGNPTTFSITIEAPGFALTRTAFDWKEMAEPEVQDYRLPRATPFGGRIVDPQGKPIAGAEVELFLQPMAVCRDGTMAKHRRFVGSQLHVRTGADGMFAFRNVPPDTGPQQLAYWFDVRHPKYQGRRKQYAQNEFLGDGWEVSLEPGATIRGVVVDEAGRPVEGASVTVQGIPEINFSPPVATDAKGQFRFDNLPPLTLPIQVEPLAHVHKMTEGTAERGEPAEIKITVENGEFFEGKVVDLDDKPLAGVYVGYMIPIDPKGEGPQPGRPNVNVGSRMSTSREDGTFRVGPVAKGRYRIRAIRQNGPDGNTNGHAEADSGAKDVVIKVGAGQEF